MGKKKRSRKESESSTESSSKCSSNKVSRYSSSSSAVSHLKYDQHQSQKKQTRTETSPSSVFQQSLIDLQSYIDNKFASLTSSIANDTTERVSKRLKQTTHDFKYKGNKEQFNFNQEIIDSLQEAVTSPQVDNLVHIVQKTVKSLKDRDKLIKLADKSEAGWDLVTEYVARDEALDSEDDKKIRRAEKRALQKRKGRRSRRTTIQPGYSSGNQRTGLAGNNSFRPFRLYNASIPASSYTTHTTSPFPNVSSNFNGFQSSSGQRYDSTFCFSCGQQGHWRNSCPIVHAATRQHFRPGIQTIASNFSPTGGISGAGPKPIQ